MYRRNALSFYVLEDRLDAYNDLHGSSRSMYDIQYVHNQCKQAVPYLIRCNSVRSG